LGFTDEKVPVYSTNIPYHLEKMLSTLKEEEEEASGGSTVSYTPVLYLQVYPGFSLATCSLQSLSAICSIFSGCFSLFLGGGGWGLFS
jgi:hypothetical protein